MFKDSRLLDRQRTASSFTSAYQAYQASAENWFDGTVNSIDKRLVTCNRLLHSARSTVARLTVTESQRYLRASERLGADLESLASLRDDLLNGASNRADVIGPPGWRTASDSSQPSFEQPQVPSLPSAVGKKPKKIKNSGEPDGWKPPPSSAKLGAAVDHMTPLQKGEHNQAQTWKNWKSAPAGSLPVDGGVGEGLDPKFGPHNPDYHPNSNGYTMPSYNEGPFGAMTWADGGTGEHFPDHDNGHTAALHQSAYPPQSFMKDAPSGGQGMWDPEVNDWAVNDNLGAQSAGGRGSWNEGPADTGTYFGQPPPSQNPGSMDLRTWDKSPGHGKGTIGEGNGLNRVHHTWDDRGNPPNSPNVSREEARAPGNPTFASLAPTDQRWVTLEGRPFLAANTDALDDSHELAIRAHNHAALKTSTFSSRRSAAVCEAFVSQVVELGRQAYRPPVQRTAAADPDFGDQAIFL